MRYSPEELTQLDDYLRSGNVAGAILLYEKHYPPRGERGFPDLNEDDIAATLKASAPALAFLNPEELRELQIASAHILCGGSAWSPQKFFKPGFAWPHDLHPRIAIRYLNAWASWQRNLKSLDCIRTPVVFRISHSCDPGTCEACTEAGKYLYSRESVPDFPLASCSNLKDGCRCSWSSYAVKNRAEIESLLKKFALKLHPSDNIAE